MRAEGGELSCGLKAQGVGWWLCVCVFGGGVEGGVGVCLCGIRQCLGWMTGATRKFPVRSSSLGPGGRQQS